MNCIFQQCTVVKTRCKDIMICMKCWGLEVKRTFILCMGTSLQKHKVPRAQSWNGSSWKHISCCLCWLTTTAYVTGPTFLKTGYWPFYKLTANMLKWVVRQGSHLPPEIPDFRCSGLTITSSVAVSWLYKTTLSEQLIFSSFSCLVSRCIPMLSLLLKLASQHSFKMSSGLHTVQPCSSSNGE